MPAAREKLTVTTQPEPAPAPSPALSIASRFDARNHCVAEICPDGSAHVHIRIDPAILRRIMNRAQSQDLADYLWLNIFRRALEDHVY